MNLLEISDFWSHVDVGSDTECWPWRRRAKGYGSFRIKSEQRTAQAHRIAYEIVKGPIRKGNLVRHSCDHKPCCNPRHLLQGTARDGAEDRVARGRTAPGAAKRIDAERRAKGELPVSLKEKTAFVAMRHGLLPIAIIAERAGVSRATAFRWAKKAKPAAKARKAVEDELWTRAMDEAKKGS